MHHHWKENVMKIFKTHVEIRLCNAQATAQIRMKMWLVIDTANVNKNRSKYVVATDVIISIKICSNVTDIWDVYCHTLHLLYDEYHHFFNGKPWCNIVRFTSL